MSATLRTEWQCYEEEASYMALSIYYSEQFVDGLSKAF
jgi:hypothetical protein